MSDNRVGVLDALAELRPGLSANRILHYLLILLTIACIANAIFLVIAIDGWSISNFSILELCGYDRQYFFTRTGDCFYLTIVQVTLLPLVCYGAIKSSRSELEEEEDESANEKTKSCDYFRCCDYILRRGNRSEPNDNEKSNSTPKHKHRYHIIGSGTHSTPLLASVDLQSPDNHLTAESQKWGHTGADELPTPCREGPDGSEEASIPRNLSSRSSLGAAESSSTKEANIHVTVAEGEGAQDKEADEGYEAVDNAIKHDSKKTDEAYLKKREKARSKKDIWLAGLFALSTLIQGYLGLKCISFHFQDETRQGALMGLSVLLVNLLVWNVREIINAETKESGELILSIHPHRLHLHLALAGHWCDQCSQQISGGRAYRCKLCDFDLCMKCFAKRNSLTLEGQLRGDKGMKSGDTITGDKYFWRGMALVKTEWQLFTGAMLCLIAGNALSLLSPNYQGRILDAVVHADEDHFNSTVLAYLILSIIAGAFGGLRSLLFNIIGRKLSNTIRIKLYKGIVVQDIAFFDGNSSGQLTSRLTNDVSFMVTPIQSMLGTLVSNTILLIGGIAFCFVTSWRLSVLAFITIGPAMHMTQVYAAWSQRLNRQIFSALAMANGYATEALTHIRTVKAFSTETFEQMRFEEAVKVSLLNGIRDAFGGAGMYTISSYLDLLTGVLILWYGGSLAMRGEDGLSPGKLITYQLYWNMMTSAYKGLLDILTSFTRAGGAAQRVFALMDSLPDIDIDAGLPVRTLPPQLSPHRAPIVPALSEEVLGTLNTDLSASTSVKTPTEIERSTRTESGADSTGTQSAKDIGKHNMEGFFSILRSHFHVEKLPASIYTSGITDLQGRIDFQGVNFAYQMRPDVPVLTDINITIPAGSTCALVGRSGGGKSTLVNLMMRFYDPQKGRVLLDGVDLSKLKLRDVRKYMGVVQQNTELFGGSIEDNIVYGMEPGSWTRASVIEAAKKACAHDFIRGFPDGYSTRVGERGVRISGGQRQRIAIARAFLRKPKILLLDEATSALDAESEGKVQEAPDRLIAEGGATVVLVAHRLSTVVNADQIIVISDGRVVESGSHEDLISNGGQYYKLVQRQIKKINEALNSERVDEE